MIKMFYACLAFMNFLPLWVIVVFLDCKALFWDHVEQNGTEWCGLCGCCIGILISSLVVVMGLNENKGQKGGRGIIVEAIEERKVMSAEVLLSYVLPLLAFDFGSWVGMVQFLLFFFVILLLQVRHNAITGNVFLELLGYRFYDCKYYNEEASHNEETRIAKDAILITRSYLGGEDGVQINVAFLNNQVALEVEDGAPSNNVSPGVLTEALETWRGRDFDNSKEN